MTTFALQLIALISMVIDHLGWVFFNNDFFLRSIGRFAFIIYAFLIAQTFIIVKDNQERFKSHFKFYLLLAILSEIPYDLLNSTIDTQYSNHNINAVFTLLIGFIGLYFTFDRQLSVKINIALLAVFISFLARSDYMVCGVFIIFAFYFYLLKFRDMQYYQRVVVLGLVMFVYVALYQWMLVGFSNIHTLAFSYELWFLTYYPSYFLIPFLLAFYNGNVGYKNKIFKNIYRYFYPAHLLLLWFLANTSDLLF